MDEESCTVKKEDTFHLNNWKRLIYIMSEIEQNVVDDRDNISSQNRNEDVLIPSRWSWPWKIQKGKVFASASQDIINTSNINSPFTESCADEKDLMTRRCSFHEESVTPVNDKYKTNNIIAEGENTLDHNYNITSALGKMSYINLVAMGIAVPNGFVNRHSFEQKENSHAISHSPLPVCPMNSCHDSTNLMETTSNLPNSSELEIPTNTENNFFMTFSSFLRPNKKISPATNNGDGENVVSKEKELASSLSSNKNLYDVECEMAYESKFMEDMSVQFKHNDHTSQQTSKKLCCDTESQLCNNRCCSVHLVSNRAARETQGIIISCPSSVVSEKQKRKTKVYRHSIETKSKLKHLLRPHETATKTVTDNDTLYDNNLYPDDNSSPKAQFTSQQRQTKAVTGSFCPKDVFNDNRNTKHINNNSGCDQKSGIIVKCKAEGNCLSHKCNNCVSTLVENYQG